jgi:hypothetical protein
LKSASLIICPVLPVVCALSRCAVKVHIKSRLVTVQGPRGTLKRSFKHLAVDMSIINGGKQVRPGPAAMHLLDRPLTACCVAVVPCCDNTRLPMRYGSMPPNLIADGL